MQTTFRTTVWRYWAFPCLALFANVAHANSAAHTGASVKATQHWEATCSSGNFTGTVTGQSVAWGENAWTVGTLQYRIVKRNGQQGGNKANINFRLGAAPSMSQATGWSRSPDKMVQNGSWYQLHLLNEGNYQQAMAEIEFVFDKSGSDPRCTVRVPLRR